MREREVCGRGKLEGERGACGRERGLWEKRITQRTNRKHKTKNLVNIIFQILVPIAFEIKNISI